MQIEEYFNCLLLWRITDKTFDPIKDTNSSHSVHDKYEEQAKLQMFSRRTDETDSTVVGFCKNYHCEVTQFLLMILMISVRRRQIIRESKQANVTHVHKFLLPLHAFTSKLVCRFYQKCSHLTFICKNQRKEEKDTPDFSNCITGSKSRNDTSGISLVWNFPVTSPRQHCSLIWIPSRLWNKEYLFVLSATISFQNCYLLFTVSEGWQWIMTNHFIYDLE